MATPAFLRYLPARLKPLSSPAVWAPLTVFTLLSVFIWEYHKNPDWFNRPQLSNLNPDSELTAEEQARLAEIDTLDLLLRSARTPDGENLSTGLLSPEELGLADDATAGAESDRTLAGRDNPFAAYEAQYKFPGSDSNSGEIAANRTPLAGGSNSALGTLSAETDSPNVGTSALAEALNRQQADRSNTANSTLENSTGPDGSLTFDGTSEGVVSSSNGSDASRLNADGLSVGNNGGSVPFSTQASNSSGISAPFIPTTTEMSPPVGTTGYQVPASASLPVFNAPPQQPTRNPFNRSQTAVPAAPAAPAASAATSVPQVNYTAPSFTQPEQNSRRQSF